MKSVTIKVDFPERFTENEVVQEIMSQIDTRTFNSIGIYFSIVEN